MRKYPDDVERTIRVRQLVGEWTRSGLLTSDQQGRLAADLAVDVRRTNRFLRATMVVFGLLIIAAAVGLVLVTASPNEEETAGVICLIAGAACAALAEFLTSRFRLYRFGVEEACAAGAVLLAGIGTGLLFAEVYGSRGEPRIVIALLVGSTAAFAVFARFGFAYAALAAMVGLALAPFGMGLAPPVERTIAVAAVGVCFIIARIKRLEHGDDFPGDEYALIQAAAFAGGYAILNLHLTPGWYAQGYPSWFIWATYAGIWILPVAGLWLSVRAKDRPLLDVSLAIAIATIATNKPYLGLERKPWDPILLGLLLIGVALTLRRWLARGLDGRRAGFSATQILRREKELLSHVATISTAFQPGITPRAPEPRPDTTFDGGRSGGGGAGGSY